MLRWATFLGCTALLFQFISYNFVDIDIWHEVSLIRESVSLGHLLRTDPYAYTPTIYPMVDHEWGSGAVAYFGTMWFGPRTILVLKFLTALGAGFFCILCAQSRGADFRLLGVCAPLAIYLGRLGFLSTIRAQAYSFCFTAVWLFLLEQDRLGKRLWMIAALAIFPFWVNLHGGFVVALGVTTLYAAEELIHRQPARRILLLLAALFLEMFFNPYGLSYFGFISRALFMARPYASEWGSVKGLGTEPMLAFVLALLIGLYSLWKIRWYRAPGSLILAATAVEAALHRKLLPLFAIAWLSYVPAWLAAAPLAKWWVKFAQRRSRFLSWAWIALACACCFAAMPLRPWNLQVPQPLYPVGPVQYLAEQKFAGNLMVPFRLGAYISWKLYPAVKVSLDSRYEVAYPDAVVQQITDFYDARSGWQSTLDSFPTDAVLVPLDAPISHLIAEKQWFRVYSDAQFQIYARSPLVLPVADRKSASFQGTFP